MIEDIAGINTEFQGLGFGQLEGLLEVRIKSPGSGHFDGALSECAATSGKRILEHDLIAARIHDRVQRTKGVEALCSCHGPALRVLHGLECAVPEIASAGGVGSGAPADSNVLRVE